ncbi:MAG: sortase [Ruminococcus sp.]|nr:sortase [Ruminococcus sp.]
MKNKLRILFILTGTVLILSALFLCLYNINESKRAYKDSENTLAELKTAIPEPVESTTGALMTTLESDLFAPYETVTTTAAPEPAKIELDGRLYCGYLTLSSLGMELPVADSLTYPALRTSPCRYSGSVSEGDLVIAAHNYNSHFGRIKELLDGDVIIFTDCSGTSYSYTVVNVESVNGTDVSYMLDNSSDEWQLTLFTCDLSGRSRVAVRAAINQ